MYPSTLLACVSTVLLLDAVLSTNDEAQVFTKVAGSRNIGLDRWREYPKGDVWLSKLTEDQPEKRAIRFGGHSDSAFQRFNKKSAFYRFNRAGEEEGFEPDALDGEAFKRSGFYRFNKRSRRDAEAAEVNAISPKRSGFYRFNKKSWDAESGSDGDDYDKRNGFYRFNRHDDDKREAFYRFNKKNGYYPLDGQDIDDGNPLYRLVDPDEEVKRSGNWRFMKKNADDEMDEEKRSGFYRFNREPILRGDLNPENFNKKGKMPKLRFGEKRSSGLGDYLGEADDEKRSGYWRFNKRQPDGSDEDFEKKSAIWRFTKREDEDDKRSGSWRFMKREDGEESDDEFDTDDKRSAKWRFMKRDDDKRSGFYRFNKKDTADKYGARWTFGEDEEEKKRSGYYRFNKRQLDDSEEEKRSGFYRFNKKDSSDAATGPAKRSAPEASDEVEQAEEVAKE